MTNEPDPEVEREKLMALIERQLSGGPTLEGVPYVWPDLLDDGRPGGFFKKWLNAIGFLPVAEPVTAWFDGVPHVHTRDDDQRDVDWGDCHDETGAWVQGAQDAIFARLHRGDDPACDCGASDG